MVGIGNPQARVGNVVNEHNGKGFTPVSQKIKAPDSKSGTGFIWTLVAIIAIAAVVIGLFVWKNTGDDKLAEEMPQEDVNFTVTREDNAVVLASKDVKKDAPKVEIFEDFSCPHCGELARADHQDALKALNDGEIVLKYHFMNFLDGEARGSSTRGAAVALAVAETGNAKAFWNLHKHVMFNQADVARNWDYEKYAGALSAYGLDQGVIDSIKSGSVEEAVISLVDGNEEELKKREGSVSSPVVYANGKQVQLKQDANRQPMSWVPEVVKK